MKYLTVSLAVISLLVLHTSAEPEPVIGVIKPVGLSSQSLDSPFVCSSAKSCGSCISQGCAWCIASNVNDSREACYNSNEHDKCHGNIVDPPSDIITTTLPEGNSSSPVEISPTKANLKLRVGRNLNLPLTIHVSKNQNLDLYYLTDVSTSMGDDLDLLKKIGRDLEEAMRNITSRFAIGFGTFIDKKMLPYYDKYLNKENPTEEDKESLSCHASFGYCNAMPLKENGGEEFIDAVSEARTFTNLDSPEGGLEALMQVFTCSEAVNWRPNARKIVVYASDSMFHYAGDGKLAGIDKRNDGECHLDPENKFYTHSTLHDYPSVAQIGKAAEDSKVHVIFAVTKSVFKIYEELHKHVPDSRTAELLGDSSNIINVIIDEYNSLTSTLKLQAKYDEDLLDVTFSYDCPKGNKNDCKGLTPKSQANAIAQIKLKKCPENVEDRTSEIRIFSTGVAEDVILSLEFICDCECDKVQQITPNAVACNWQGSLVCGQCNCTDEYYGTDCRCSGLMSEDKNKCKKNTNDGVCSGRGECECGECKCHKLNPPKLYQGKYCECSNFDCPRANGKTCNGKGSCSCNKCQCEENWTGEDCSCHDVSENCITSGSNQTCSGNGDCECNSCQCHYTGNEGNEKFFGKYCQDCATCGGRCSSLDICVKCYLLEKGDTKIDSSELNCEAWTDFMKCRDISISVAEVPENEKSTISTCTILKDDCDRFFYYKQSDVTANVYISSDWSCVFPLWLILVITLGLTVLIGLIVLLVFVMLKRRRDRLEIEKLKAEVANAMNSGLNNENALYRDPNTNVQNPLFGKKLN